MMEGLLQGRVVYSYEEFKRRKFDKLFHYIIDILNILVPYVFHRAYLEHVEAIISHYFDMFMVSHVYVKCRTVKSCENFIIWAESRFKLP